MNNSVNFKKEVQTLIPTVRSTGWIKNVTAIDKSKKNGFSLIGEFCKKGDFECKYEDGIYVDCSKLRKPKQVNYHVFKVTNGNFELLQTIEDADKTWAVQLWETIEDNLSKDPNYKARELANLVLEQCSNKNTLDEVAKILLSDTFKRELAFRNDAHFQTFLNSNRCFNPWSHEKEWKEAFDNYIQQDYNPYEATVLAWTTTVAYKQHTHGRFSVKGEKGRHFYEEEILNGDIEIDFRRVHDQFEVFEDFFFSGIYTNNNWEFFRLDEFKDTNYYGFYFDLRNYVLVHRHYKEGDWDKDRLVVRVFGDAFKHRGHGLLE